MKNSVTKAAVNFIKNSIKKKVDFDTITKYLKTKGYTVEFYDSDEGNKLIDSFGLGEFSKTVQAFTVWKNDLKFVFMQSDVPPEDKLYLLLHETGHIELEHLNTNTLTVNSRLQDIEADTFAYTVLNHKDSKPYLKVLAVCAVIFFAIVAAHLQQSEIITTSTDKLVSTSGDTTTDQAKLVYVTHSGAKFHLPDCQYVKNKDCNTLTRAEAAKKYAPCSVCRP